MTHDKLKQDIRYRSAQAVALTVLNVEFEGALYDENGPNFMGGNTPWKRLTEDGHQKRWLIAYLVGVAAMSEHLGDPIDDLFEVELAYVQKVATDMKLREPEIQISRWEEKARELVKSPKFKEACREVESELQKEEWRELAKLAEKRPNMEDVRKVIEKHLPVFPRGWVVSI